MNKTDGEVIGKNNVGKEENEDCHDHDGISRMNALDLVGGGGLSGGFGGCILDTHNGIQDAFG